MECLLTIYRRVQELEVMWRSFLESVTGFTDPLRVIALDDSDDSEVSSRVSRIFESVPRGSIEVRIEHIVHPRNLGQRESLEVGLAMLTDPVYLHLQEDWAFSPGTTWLADSLALVQANVADIVWIREHPQAQQETHRHANLCYRLVSSSWPGPGDDHIWHGFTYNPGVRRTVYSQTAGTPVERDVDRWFGELGGRAVLLVPPVVRHIGDNDRSTRHIRCKHPSDP